MEEFERGSAVQTALCCSVNGRGCAGLSVFRAGGLTSIAVDCSSKGRATRQRCQRKVARFWSGAGFSLDLPGTITAFKFCRSSRPTGSWLVRPLASKWDEKFCLENDKHAEIERVRESETRVWPSEVLMGLLCCTKDSVIAKHRRITGLVGRAILGANSDRCEMCSCGFSIWIFGDLFHGNCFSTFSFKLCTYRTYTLWTYTYTRNFIKSKSWALTLESIL